MTTNQDHKPTYSHIQMEAALCIWEDLLERNRGHHKDPSSGGTEYQDEASKDFGAALYEYWENNGTVEMRHAAINMSARAVEDFAALEAAIGRDEIDETWGSYDWEWIPAWVYATLDISGQYLTLKDSGTVVQGMIREHYKHRVSKQMWMGAVSRGETELGWAAWLDAVIASMMKEGHVGE